MVNADGTSRAWVGVSDLTWLNALAALVFATAVTVLLISALGHNSSQRGWVVPLAIGVEFNAIRRTEAVPDPARRAAPVLTLSLLSIAELLAFSMLVQFGMRTCGPGAVWHEYLSFLIIAQAVSTGLATAVWLLIAEPAKPAKPAGVTVERPRQCRPAPRIRSMRSTGRSGAESPRQATC